MRNTGPGATVSLEEDDFDPFHEARMVSAVIDGIRFVSLYAPNGRVVGSAVLRRQARAGTSGCSSGWTTTSTQRRAGGRWRHEHRPDATIDVWDERAVHGGTHVSRRSARRSQALLDWGLDDGYRSKRPEPRRFTWWDYRAGNFHKNLGMRIDHLLLTPPVAKRLVWAEIDREARKGVPMPSDHAPLFVDIDAAGVPIDAGWEGALERIAARTKR